MNIKEGIEFSRLLDSVRSSNGFKLYRQLLNIRSSFLIYYENRISLKRSIKRFNEDFLNYTSYKDSDIKRWKKQRIIVKDLYNLISSAQNFAAHVKKENEISDTGILFKFFRELRNMLVHHNSFELVARRVFNRSADENVVVFQSMAKTVFMKYLVTRRIEKPKSASYFSEIISYLENLDDGFNFEVLLSGYCSGIDKLYTLYVSKFIKHNSDDLKIFSTKVNAVHKYANLPINQTELRFLNYLLNR